MSLQSGVGQSHSVIILEWSDPSGHLLPPAWICRKNLHTYILGIVALLVVNIGQLFISAVRHHDR